MIGVVALLVIGPERLPRVARVGGFWLGKAKGYVSSVKQELSRELEVEELKQSVMAENPIEEISELSEALNKGRQKTSESVKQTVDELSALDGSKEDESAAKK